jgi:hypothetical protein
MKKFILPIFVVLLSWSFPAFAQVTLIQSFDNIAADTNFVWASNVEGGKSYLTWKQDSSDKVEGAASLDIKTAIDSLHAWGSFSQLIYREPAGSFSDWSSSDTLHLWVKIVKAPTYPQYMSFRIQLVDKGISGTDQLETFIYQNDVLLDATTSWIELKVPLHEIDSKGRTVTPGDSGFVEAPGSWGGFTYNDDKLNIDKIVGWNIVCVTTTTSANPNPPAGFTNVPLDSLEFKIDYFGRSGNKAIPFVIFNGQAVPNNLGAAFTWGNASVDLQTGNGPIPNTNTIHWLMGDQWGNGWNGFGYNVSPTFNLSGGWPVDSLSFYLKSQTGVDTLRVQFEDGSAKVGKDFGVIQDTLWHRYAIALRDITTREDSPLQPGNFDPSKIAVWQIMPEADGKAGINVWLSDVWTGHPSAPVPPVAPTGVAAIPNNNLTNSVIWSDVPNQSGETYNVYYSTSPITDITSTSVEVAATGVAHGSQIFVHKLLAPATDQTVSYYYAVVCKSGDGLLGTPGVTAGKVTNTAKGVSIINPTAPAGFVADGDLSEWTAANIKPFRVFFSDNSGTVVQNTNVTSDTVSSGLIYVAVDQNNLYVAGHINTNNIIFNPALSSWFNTATDIFIGLYNAHGTPHTSLQTGAESDYHMRFVQNRIIIDNDGVDSLEVIGDNYFWGSRFPDPLAGYNFEAKIPWTDLAHKGNAGVIRTNPVFVPQVGMRIPFDIELSSCSPTATQRDGQLDYSSIANGNSYSNVTLWSNTWIGDSWTTGVKDSKQKVSTYKLAQNYPNPFNPTTKIQYSIMKAGMVTLNVYDILGRKVATLVNENQSEGTHTVNFDASKLTSGVYFYRIESGSFMNIKKMMLVK